MSLEAALYTLVTTDPGVSALIGTRLYPNFIPQDAPLPAMAYLRASTVKGYTQNGPDGVAKATIQFTIDGPTFAQSRAAADALFRLLSGYRGKVGDQIIGASFQENDHGGYNLSSDQTAIYQDYRISYRE